MNEFAAALLDQLLLKILAVRGNGFVTRQIIDGIRSDCRKHPDMLPDAIQKALDASGCALILSPATRNDMTFTSFKSYIRGIMPAAKFLSSLTRTELDDAAVGAMEGILNATDAKEVDWPVIQAVVKAAAPLIDALLSHWFIPDWIKTGWQAIKAYLLMEGFSAASFQPE